MSSWSDTVRATSEAAKSARDAVMSESERQRIGGVHTPSQAADANRRSR